MVYFDFFSQKMNPEQVLANEPMKNHTSFRTGGPADVLILPRGASELAAVIGDCRTLGFPHMVIGNGSNLLFPDEGYRGAVIKTAGGLDACEADGRVITAGAGISLSALANAALERGLTGLEFASGIPGTLGGAVYMNAGAYEEEIKDVFLWADVLTEDGIVRMTNEDMQFSYRYSALQDARQGERIALKAAFFLRSGDPGKIREKMSDLNTRRKARQPLEYPSAGSTFKRPEGHFAGKLIADSGLAGFTVGGAQVSEKHCGFVINRDNASSKDILELIRHVQETVMEKFGVQLEPEVRIV